MLPSTWRKSAPPRTNQLWRWSKRTSRWRSSASRSSSRCARLHCQRALPFPLLQSRTDLRRRLCWQPAARRLARCFLWEECVCVFVKLCWWLLRSGGSPTMRFRSRCPLWSTTMLHQPPWIHWKCCWLGQAIKFLFKMQCQLHEMWAWSGFYTPEGWGMVVSLLLARIWAWTGIKKTLPLWAWYVWATLENSWSILWRLVLRACCCCR